MSVVAGANSRGGSRLRVVPYFDHPIVSGSTGGVPLQDTGSWTPVLTAGVPFVGNANGTWVKTGKVVTIQGYIDNNTGTGTSGNVSITGLPFASSATGPTFSMINLGNATITLTGGRTAVLGRLGPSATTLLLIEYGVTGVGFNTVPSTAIGSATFIYINGSYVTDA